MEASRISSRQLFYLILCMIASLSLALVPSLLVRHARQGLWLSLLVATLIDLLIAAMVYALGRRFPGRTPFEYSLRLLGPALGSAAGLTYAWLFLYAAALSVRAVSDFFKLIMPETPLSLFVWALALNAGYGAKKGLEVIARTVEILGPLTVLASLGVVLGTLNRWDPAHLEPLVPDLGRALYASLLPASWFGLCAILGVLMAYHVQPAKALAVKAMALALGSALVGAMTLAAVLTLGPSLAAVQTVPVYSAARLIEFGRFVERVELLFLGAALIPGLVAQALMVHAATLGAAQVLRLADYRPLVWPVATLAATLASGSVRSQVDLFAFMDGAFPLFALTVEVGLTAVLLGVAVLSGAGVRRPTMTAPSRRRARTGRRPPG